MKSFTRLALALSVSFAAFGASAQSNNVLRVSAIPDEAPTELQRKFTPLGDYLKKETGMDVVFTPVTDYAAVVEGLATHKIDLAWLGGFTYVQARIRTNGGVVPIAQRAEDAAFTSKFIVPNDSTAKTLADLPREPEQALTLAGSGAVAAFGYASLPIVMPQWLAYTLYRWEMNIRTAAVPGFAGGGGLGQLLYFHLSIFQQQQTMTVLLAMFALVAVVDGVSARLRRVLGPVCA